VPRSPQSRHRTFSGRRSDPLPWLTHSPSGNTRIAARAVGRELVVVFMESGDAAEVDHGVMGAPSEDERLSQTIPPVLPISARHYRELRSNARRAHCFHWPKNSRCKLDRRSRKSGQAATTLAVPQKGLSPSWTNTRNPVVLPGTRVQPHVDGCDGPRADRDFTSERRGPLSFSCAA